MEAMAQASDNKDKPAVNQTMTANDLFLGSNQLEVVNFYVNQTKFSTPVSQVRYIEQDKRKTTRIDTNEGHNEVTTYQDKPVPIYDFCHLLNTRAEYKDNLELLQTLHGCRNEHESWLNHLQDSIQHGSQFKCPTNAQDSEFGNWLINYETEDEQLGDLLKSLEGPHNKIFELAHYLNVEQKEEALKAIQEVRTTILERLKDLFRMVIERVESITRPILLYIDCGEHLVAIRLNAIDDIVSYGIDQFSTAEEISNESKALNFVTGYFRSENEPPCVLLDWRLFNAANFRIN